MKLGITYNDWLSSLEAPINDGTGAARTAAEIAQVAGVTSETIVKRMRKGIAGGWVRVVRVHRVRVDGVRYMSPAYVLTPPKEAP